MLLVHAAADRLRCQELLPDRQGGEEDRPSLLTATTGVALPSSDALRCAHVCVPIKHFALIHLLYLLYLQSLCWQSQPRWLAAVHLTTELKQVQVV
jgi:hypothetical protein